MLQLTAAAILLEWDERRSAVSAAALPGACQQLLACPAISLINLSRRT
jgi:hypothetical protein